MNRRAAPQRSFLDLDELTASEVKAILAEAHRRKAARKGRPQGARDEDAPLADRVLAMIFEKSSTRTRVSFDMAIRQLGGSAVVLTAAETQLGRGETVEDTARVLSRMVDAVMIRANRHADLLAFEAAASVPVINGLTDRSHPCQIIADIMAVEERLGPIAGKTLAWIGDGNNVCVSFLQASALLGFHLRICTPPAYAAPVEEVRAARDRGAVVALVNDPLTAAAGVDAVVTDTWVSMGDTDKDARMAAFAPYQVTHAVMDAAAPGALFLHCLPAHRGEEVVAGVIDGPASVVFDEAENRVHAQKAILMWCFGLLAPAT